MRPSGNSAPPIAAKPRSSAIRLGVNLPHYGQTASPGAVREVALAAEQIGFDSVWAVDHLVLPRSTTSLYDLGRSPAAVAQGNLRRALSPLFECLTVLAFVAGATQQLKLGTGVLVLPLRNPLYAARQIATIDAVSGGRLLLGVGVGWLQEEAEAMQMEWDNRGDRTDEQIEIFRKLWKPGEEYVSHKGRFYRFPDIDPAPYPAQQDLPVLVGGHSRSARERAGRLGNGWITHRLPVTEQAIGMEQVREAAASTGRDPSKLLFYASLEVHNEGGEVESPGTLVRRLESLSELGVDHIQLIGVDRSASALIGMMEWFGQHVIGERHAET